MEVFGIVIEGRRKIERPEPEFKLGFSFSSFSSNSGTDCISSKKWSIPGFRTSALAPGLWLQCFK